MKSHIYEVSEVNKCSDKKMKEPGVTAPDPSSHLAPLRRTAALVAAESR